MRVRKSIPLFVAATVTLLSAPAVFADRGYGPPAGVRGHGGYRDAQRAEEYARVLNVEPITRRIRVSEPRRECYQETRYDAGRRDDRRPWVYGSRGAPTSAGQMILGGVVGAAVGNQFGRGDGRRAATVAGALIGSAIGHDVAARSQARGDEYRESARYGYRDGYDDEPRAYTVERCDTRYDERWDERVEGYWVTYEYNGREFRTRMPYDPGRELRVRVDVTPQR